MLFTYSPFWKTLTILFSSWVFYTVFDFEFAVITLLSLLLATSINKKY